MNDNNDNNKINNYIANYGGATIGGLIALILCFTEIYKILINTRI